MKPSRGKRKGTFAPPPSPLSPWTESSKRLRRSSVQNGGFAETEMTPLRTSSPLELDEAVALDAGWLSPAPFGQQENEAAERRDSATCFVMPDGTA